MKKLLVNPGDIFLIPLFLYEEPCIKSFSRQKFDNEDMRFCLGRVIADEGGSGTIIEVFSKIVNNVMSVDVSFLERLFEPVLVAGEGFKKKRWRVIGSTENYDPVTDSKYNEIKFIIGPRDNPRLWTPLGEKVLCASDKSTERMIVWTSDQLELRIIESL